MTLTSRWWIALLSVFAFSVSFAQKSEDEIRSEVQTVIKKRHPTDSAEWWLSLGSRAPNVIMRMYEENTNTFQKVRLLQGLGWFDDAAATEFIKEQTRSAKKSIIKRTGLKTIGLTKGAEEAKFLEEFLSDEKDQTRYAAAEGLQFMSERTGDSKVNKLLDAYKKTERKSWILSKLAKKAKKTKTPLNRKDKRIDGRFVGKWSGSWVSPDSKSKKVNTFSVRVELEYQTTEILKGTLEIRDGFKKRKMILKSLKGKQRILKGTLVDTSSWFSSKELPFVVKLDPSIQPGVGAMSFSIESKGTFALLRR